ncbi:MAG: hypothetical protein ABIO45_04555 [Burkholderiaceae bacterium]
MQSIYAQLAEARKGAVMRNKTPAQQLHRRVWRVSAHAPLGEVVDIDGATQTRPAEPDTKRGEAANAPAEREFGWRQSSFELSDGLEVREDHDTVPADLWDEFFKR